ncbi:MAG: hypothetical protein IJ218_00445 [Alphaproteobacteria bacterium]|nr:hypothetical protein [Alphaproteobacteria bacterium]
MTDAQIGLRCPKSDEYKYGWKKVDSIPADEVCVVYLGGDGATDDRKANGYTKVAQNDIKTALQIDVPIYGVTYDFAGKNPSFTRKIQFLKHRAATLLSAAKAEQIKEDAADENADEAYLEKLYKNIMEPRIVPMQKGRRYSAEEIARNIRKITFVTHCHGGYVAYELEKRMRKQLESLGYSLQERKNILSQMLVVAHAPSCPLGVQQSSFYSFRSAYDGQGETGWGILPEYIRNRKREERIRFAADQNGDTPRAAQNRYLELKPSYLEKKRLFIIKQKHPWLNDEDGPFMTNPDEHGDITYGHPQQTPDGKCMMFFSRNLMISGVKNSIENAQKFTPLPPLEELIAVHDVNMDSAERQNFNAKLASVYKTLCANGKKLIAEAIKDLQTHGR